MWTYARKQICICFGQQTEARTQSPPAGFPEHLLGRVLGTSLRTSSMTDAMSTLDLMPPGQALVEQCVFADVV